ncbi:MAG: GAF domain-containing protein [Myxococcales bacterium]|nr:GAF domain-containing protein [Myxococcales bacterium]
MSYFEVQEIADGAAGAVVIEARHWTEALVGALEVLGEPVSMIDRMTVDRDDASGIVRVQAAPSARAFEVRPSADLDAELTTAAPPPPPPPRAATGDAPATSAATPGKPSKKSKPTKARGTITTGVRVADLRSELQSRVVKGGVERATPGKASRRDTVSDSAIEAVFLRLAPLLATSEDALIAADRVADFMVSVFPAEGHAVLFFDDLDHVFRFAAVRGPGAKKVLKTTVPSGAGVVGFALRADVTIQVDDTSSDERFFGGVDATSGLQTRAVLCAPISYNGRTWGCVELVNPTAGSFGDQDANALSYLGRSFGEWIDQLPLDD